MKLSIQVQILNKALCVSLCANVLGKGMTPSIPPTHPVMNEL